MLAVLLALIAVSSAVFRGGDLGCSACSAVIGGEYGGGLRLLARGQGQQVIENATCRARQGRGVGGLRGAAIIGAVTAV